MYRKIEQDNIRINWFQAKESETPRKRELGYQLCCFEPTRVLTFQESDKYVIFIHKCKFFSSILLLLIWCWFL